MSEAWLLRAGLRGPADETMPAWEDHFDDIAHDEALIPRSLEELRRGLDAALVGQAEAKRGLLLALLAREHAYLEGPPGCGKTVLAEALARVSGARMAAVRCHRDLRESDLLGDVRLRRRPLPAGEALSLGVDPGPLLRAEVAVLDDISRAPGEALAPLLRILSERRALGEPIPLETAVATGVPPEVEAYVDPLEPTQLDRFAIQVRMRGTLLSRRWGDARRILDRRDPETIRALRSSKTRALLQRAAAALSLGDDVREALVSLAERLAELAGEAGSALVTDRAFGRAAPRILRAHALLRGADRVEVRDLRAVRYMIARRLPPDVQAVVGALIDELLEAAPAEGEVSTPVGEGEQPGTGGKPSERTGSSGRAGETERPVEKILSAPRGRGVETAEVGRLLRAFEGRLDRGRVERDDDPGGQPRGYRALDRLDEIEDADAVDAVLFAEVRLPGVPRVFRRQRRDAGGLVAVLRDVSASMEGRLSRWAGEVVAGIVDVASRRRMRLGYVEFNHAAERFSAGRHFFHRRYRKLLALAGTRRAEGRTNYEAPLQLALSELRGRVGRNRHIVLLTDGVPVTGDPAVLRERALARRAGVKVHTVFLGLGECPPVLDEISRETGGLRFAARPGPGGRLHVTERREA